MSLKRCVSALLQVSVAIVALGVPLHAQEWYPSDPDAGEAEYLDPRPLRIVSGAFAHLNVVGSLDATYGGVALDRVGERWGFSGAAMLGRGSEGGTWVHLPLAGVIVGVAVLLPFSFIHDLWLESTGEDADWLPGFPFEVFAMENVHRNVPLGDRVLLAPYLGVLGLDGEEGSDVDGFMSLNSGVGLNLKIFASGRFCGNISNTCSRSRPGTARTPWASKPCVGPGSPSGPPGTVPSSQDAERCAKWTSRAVRSSRSARPPRTGDGASAPRF